MACPIEYDYQGGNFWHMGAIGTRVRNLRKSKKLTQPQLASQIGIDQSTLSDIERGASIRADVLLRLASALGVSPEFVVTGADSAAWPFSTVLQSRYLALSEKQRGYVEGKLAAAIEECETNGPADQAAEDRRHFEAGVVKKKPAVTRKKSA
jgi:transcriptional regulator with XRE-family HTH domain